MTDREFREWATREWPRLRSKLECPDCGATGYAKGRWMDKHQFHRRCECGKVITVRGLRQHQVHCGMSDSTVYP